jgi:lycopene beta-cyclase
LINTGGAVNEKFDYVLVGGGLANGLVALALQGCGAPSIALVESGECVGGNHTWSFHDGDLGADERRLVAPLVTGAWPAHDVAFQGRTRRIERGYASIASTSLASAVGRSFSSNPQSALLLRESAVRLERNSVTLRSGRVLEARAVLDGRGVPRGEPADVPHRGGFQKFVGLELELSSDAPRALPLLMDARVEQIDGYRFVYVLPFSSRRVLIEDTYYSLSPRLEPDVLRQRVLSYAALHGYAVKAVLREEQGVLPIPTHASGALHASDAAIAVGMRAGWFHPTTGYSLPMAARFAALAARRSPEELHEVARAFSNAHRHNARFARFLNRLLFRAFAPESRRHVLERFYGLPVETIARFYALESSRLDRAHILCGRPPRGFSVTQLLLGDATV